MKRYLKNIIIVLLIVITCTGMYFTMDYIKNNETINESTNGQMSPPDMNEADMSEPPEKPSEDSEMSEPPEKPNGETNATRLSNNEPKSETSSKSLENKYIIILTLESLILSVLLSYLIMSNLNKKTFKEVFISSDKIIIYILLTIIFTGVFTITSKVITEKYFITNEPPSEMKKDNNTNTSYNSSNEITTSTKVNDESYTSTESNENALLISGDIKVTLSDIEVSKTGDSTESDASSFYGINSSILAKSGSVVTIKNANIETNATGANGVFTYGGNATTNNTTSDGTTINISDSTITTKKDNSGGIMTTGGGTTNAKNLKVTTSGTSSASIRTDRGGGTVTVENGSYTTNGKGSPTIYSTADITVNSATLTSNKSEGIVIEGKNSVTLNNTKLTSNNTELNGKSTTYKGIFLYQSMSGDASDGTSSFTSVDSEIITNKGDTFYVTNTSAVINLTNTKITNNDKTSNFLRIQKDSWGTTNSNGGQVSLNLTKQEINGSIVVDNISTLKMNLESTYFAGSINSDNTAKSITLKLDKSSKIKLTSDSYITSLDNADTTNSNIDFNGYKLYVNNKSIN